MERRSQLEIVYDMLKAIQDKGGKIKPTHLLYKSNLSHKRMKGYVEDLEKKGFMTSEAAGEKNMYVITEKGLKFLQEYQKVKEFTDAFGL
ncbi:hypothetical protein HY492_00870 [Candidatus Woesearchaeota archaeon]|nr:hypothetical protein [Candidatus Woesearchaeota archaeon]